MPSITGSWKNLPSLSSACEGSSGSATFSQPELSSITSTCSKRLKIIWWRSLGLPSHGIINCGCSSLSAEHSPQRWSDVSYVSPKRLQVDGKDSFHLDRWPALKRPWCQYHSGELHSAHHLNIFSSCVVGTTKKFFAVPHCRNILHQCFHLHSAIIYISFLFSLFVRRRTGCKRWTATTFSFAIPSTNSFPVTPECPRTQVSSTWYNSFTPKKEGLSPAQRLFRRPTRTKLSAHPVVFKKDIQDKIRETDQLAVRLREKANELHVHDSKARKLVDLSPGMVMGVLHHLMKRWDLIGKIMEVKSRGRSQLVRWETGRLY